MDRLSRENQSRFQSLDRIFAMTRSDAAESFSSYFVKYHSRLYREKGYLGCILDFVRGWSELLDVKGQELLDIGCGFGVYTILFTFFDTAHVFGADHNQEKFDLFSKILSMIDPPIENVTLSLQDGHKLNFEDGRFSRIFIKDVISHVRSLDDFFEEVSRLLSAGGRVLITDENNSLEFLGRKDRREKWNTHEWKGIASEDLRANDPPKTYREMRRELIAAHLAGKNLDPKKNLNEIYPRYTERDKDFNETLDTLARMTQGLWGDDVTAGADQILETGTLSTKPDFLFRDPRTGDCVEREFNPFWVAKELVKHGIDAKVAAPFYATQKPMLNAIGKVIRALHPVSVFLQPNYYIIGTKRS